ncbi:ATP-binding protein [Asanoa ferruginea]|uniref:ATP-binding protein n=1 Tax=Asanoa ferruginea TaxID=53367 RepID=UPI001477140D|nr:tetratricopeptide repeat protein [Asanoa ferruginea]
MRELRQRLGLSQEDLATKAGVDAKTIHRIEAGESLPRPSTLRRLADAMALEGADRERFYAAGRSTSPTALVPAQLPHDISGFSSRAAELARLDDILGSVHDGSAPTPIVLISGTAGIGKTALAVHWAHRVRGSFPDGQLFVNLQAFHPTGAALTAIDALRGFLEALAVPAARIPVDLAGREALYRSRLAGRRLLIVLDNAGHADQVRPLLPGAPGCLVVVTSRDRLPGLVAAEGAHPVDLDLLPPEDARELLAGRVGAARVVAESGAAEEIVSACAGLPLALVVAAARAVTEPDLPLASLAAELRDARLGLDAFATGDPGTDLRAVLSWSDQTLSRSTAELFWLLGLHGGPDIDLASTASLAASGIAAVRPAMHELTRAHLLEERSPGRFTFHDLLRAYAADQVRVHKPEAERVEALGRVLHHYLHAAYAAERLLYPQRDPIALAPAEDGVTVLPVADADAAMAWFVAEHRVLLWAVSAAHDAGLDLLAWQLAWCLTTFFDRQGHWHDWAATQRLALSAAVRLGDRPAQAFAHRNLGLALASLGRHDEAAGSLSTALVGYRELADDVGQAHTHNVLAGMHGRQGRHREALREALLASDLFGARGQRAGQARTLNNVGWYHTLLGEYEQALAACRRALALHDQIGDRYGAANTWDSLGLIHHQVGDYPRAEASYETALGLWTEVGDRYGEADTRRRLADTHLASGDVAGARAALREALAVLEDLGHPDAGEVDAKLRDLAGTVDG